LQFKLHKRSQLFICTHNEAAAIAVTMRVSNKDCSPVTIQACDAAPIPSGQAAAEETYSCAGFELIWRNGGCVLRGTSNQAIFYDNHVIAEWWHWFDWKTRAQDSE